MFDWNVPAFVPLAWLFCVSIGVFICATCCCPLVASLHDVAHCWNLTWNFMCCCTPSHVATKIQNVPSKEARTSFIPCTIRQTCKSVDETANESSKNKEIREQNPDYHMLSMEACLTWTRGNFPPTFSVGRNVLSVFVHKSPEILPTVLSGVAGQILVFAGAFSFI